MLQVIAAAGCGYSVCYLLILDSLAILLFRGCFYLMLGDQDYAGFQLPYYGITRYALAFLQLPRPPLRALGDYTTIHVDNFMWHAHCFLVIVWSCLLWGSFFVLARSSDVCATGSPPSSAAPFLWSRQPLPAPAPFWCLWSHASFGLCLLTHLGGHFLSIVYTFSVVVYSSYYILAASCG